MLLSCLKKLAPPCPRQRCRQYDNRALEFEEAMNENVNERAGVKVIAMHFIQDDDFPRQAELPDEEMISSHDAQEGLVDRAHPK